MNRIAEALYYAAPPGLQNLLVSHYGRKLFARRYGPGYDAVWADIERLSALSGADLDAEIGRRLQALVVHASEHVPYYRRLFAEHGIDPRSIDCVDALSEIPPLEKETLRSHAERFRAPDSIAPSFALQTTSGSTGTPLAIHVDRDTYRRAMGLLQYHEMLHGIAPGAPRATFAGRMVQSADRMRPPYWRYNKAENQMLFSAYHLNETSIADYVRGLDEFGPEEIIGYPSAIASLCALMRESGLALKSRPRLVVSNSETVLAWQRELIRDVLGVPVIDYYGTAEYLVFGWQQPDGRYRLHPSLGVVETVDDAGSSLFERPGQLLCTTLSNRAMPLLRFRIGDLATLASPGDSGTRGGQFLISIEGRLDDEAIAPDGSRVGRLDHVFKGVSGIRECQIVQHGPDDFELILAPGPDYRDDVTSIVHRNLEFRMGCKCTVRTTLVRSVTRGANGKFRGVISHVQSSKTVQRARLDASESADST